MTAVLSADDKAARMYDLLAGDRDQPLAPLIVWRRSVLRFKLALLDIVIGMMPRLALLTVAERAAAEGGWAWHVAQARAEVAQLKVELSLGL